MGLFIKNKAEDASTESVDLFNDWNEQARRARNPQMLTPEELLGFSPAEANTEKKQPVATASPEEVFPDGSVRSLYERMLGKVNSASSTEADNDTVSFESASIEEADAELPKAVKQSVDAVVFENEGDEGSDTSTAKTEAPSTPVQKKEDEFADFFRRLDSEISASRKSEAEEKEEAQIFENLFGHEEKPEAASVAVEEPTAEQISEEPPADQSEVERKKIDELLKSVYSTAASNSVEDSVSEVKASPLFESEHTVNTEAEPSLESTTEFNPVGDTSAEEPDAPLPRITPKHSLYGGATACIDRKAIDEFFNNSFEEPLDDSKAQKKLKKYEKQEDYESFEPDEDEVEDINAVFSDPVEDYESLDNAADIKQQLMSRRRRITVREALTLILTAAMLFINGFFFTAQGLELGIAPDIANTVLLAIVAAINYKAFISIFSGERDVDLCCSVLTLAILIQSVLSLTLFNGQGAGLGALAGFSMLVDLYGKRADCTAQLKSICVIATSERKLALSPIEDRSLSLEVAGGASGGDPYVCFGKKTVNVHGFLKNWYRPTPADKSALPLTLIAFTVAVLAGLAAALFLDIEAGSSFAVFSVALSLCCAPSLFLLNRISAKVMTDELKYYDSSVAGTNGARVLSECNTVAVNASELFPAGSVLLHNMMPLSANTVDESIAKAAAVAIAADSPLANIFKDIVRDNIDKLPKAENVKYENKLGISGWVGDECIIIGGRAIMESHNVRTPSVEFDRKIMASGYKPVYLACNGRPCLLFVVQYLADENVKFELGRLCDTGTAVVVNSTDPNITKQLICEYFELADDDVYIMSQSAAGKLSSVDRFTESADGFAAVRAKTCGMLAAVSASVRLGTIDALMKAFHILGIVAGIAGLGLMLYAKGFSMLTVIAALALELVFSCIVAAIPYLKRP